jgi:hypothetical protein
MPPRVILHTIHTVAEAIMSMKNRHVPLGTAARVVGLGGPIKSAHFPHPIDTPFAALTHECLTQRGVGVEVIDVLQRRRLIRHHVSVQCRWAHHPAHATAPKLASAPTRAAAEMPNVTINKYMRCTIPWWASERVNKLANSLVIL